MASSSSVHLLPGGRFSASVLLLPVSGSAPLPSALLPELSPDPELSSEGFVNDMVASRLLHRINWRGSLLTNGQCG